MILHASRHCRPACRGFILAEAFVAIALFGVFGLAAASLMLFATRTTIQADDRLEQTVRLDAAIERLRADVWSASTVEADANTLTCARAGAPAIVWRIEQEPGAKPTCRLTRTTADAAADSMGAQRWDHLPAGLALAARGGATAHVSIPCTPDAGVAELVLVNQRALAGRGQ